MNKKGICRNVLSFLIIGLAMNANAVIIDGTFKGTVLNVGDNGDNNNPYFVDFFSDDVVGKELSGSFWYDTDLAPANIGTNGQWRYTENTNWLGVTINVDGKTLNPASLPENFTSTGSLEMHNIADVNGFTGIHDFNPEFFGIREFITATNGNLFSEQSAGVSFLNAIAPSLSGNSLIQDFTWHDTDAIYESDDNIPALASYFNQTQSSGKEIYAGVTARISEITVSPRSHATVPEPSALVLFALGMITLVARQRKTKV